MLMRAGILYVLSVIAVLAGAIAAWQSVEVGLRDDRLAESAKEVTSAQRKLQAAVDASLSADRRARIAEHDFLELQKTRAADTGALDTLRAQLAAARQQTSVAETAMTEAEDKLAAEISANANLKAEMAEALERAKGAVTAAAAAAQTEPVKPETDITVGRIVPPDAPLPAEPGHDATATTGTPLPDGSVSQTPEAVAAPVAKSEAKSVEIPLTRIPATGNAAAPKPVAPVTGSKPQPPTTKAVSEAPRNSKTEPKKTAKKPVKDTAKPVTASSPWGSMF
jgi:hypothetical protein